MGRAGRLATWALATLLVLAALAGGGAWYFGTTGFLERVVARGVAATDGRLSVEGVSGSLYGRAAARRIVWRDGGTVASADDVAIEFDPLAVLRRSMSVSRLSAARIEVVRADTGDPARLPDSLRLPWRASIAAATIGMLVLRRAGDDAAVTLRGIEARYAYDGERHRVEHLVLTGPWGGASAAGSIAHEPPFALESAVRVAATVGEDTVAVDARLAGTLAAFDVDARTDYRGAALAAQARVEPLAQRPVGTVRVELAGLDLARLVRGLPATRIDGRIDAEVGAPGAGGLPVLAGRFGLRNAEPGPIDRGRLPIESAEGPFRLDALVLSLPEPSLLVGPPGRVGATGSVALDSRRFDLRLTTEALDLRRAHTRLASTRLAGRVALRSEGGGLAIDGRLADRAMVLDARTVLAGDALSIAEATLQARDGVARFAGELQVVEPFAFRLAGSVAGFDPSRFSDAIPGGRLNGAWQASGQVRPVLTLTGGLRLTDSRWRGLPLSGTAEGRLEPDRVRDLRLSARLGSNDVRAAGSLGAAGDVMSVVVQAGRLADLDARLAGRLHVDAELRDRLDAPSVSGSARGEQLRVGPRWRARSLEAAIVFPRGDTEPMSVTAQARGLQLDETTLDDAALELRGTFARHDLVARAGAAGRGLDVRVRADGALAGAGTLLRELGLGAIAPAGDAPWRWQGRLTEASSAQPTLSLLAPAEVAAQADGVDVRGLRLLVDGADGGTVTVERARFDGGEVQMQGAATRLPLRWLASVVPARGLRTADGDALRLGARWDVAGRVGQSGSLKGRLALFRESGDLRVDAPALEGDTEIVAAGLRRADATIEFDGDRVRAALELQGSLIGSLRAAAQTTLAWPAEGFVPTLDAPLAGTVEADLPSLAWTWPLTGEAWRFDGNLQARLALSGTVRAPRASGRITGTRLVAEQREIGMRLTDGELRADLRDNVLDIEELRFASGKGVVRMRGALRAGDDERSDAVVTLERMPVPLGPGQRLVLSGEATATLRRPSLRRATLRIRGQLRALEGVLEITGGTAPRLAKDIVVVRRAGEPPIRLGEARGGVAAAIRAGPSADASDDDDGADVEGFRITSNLQIDLGDRLRVFGSGVDARLSGVVTLAGRLPDNLRLNGTVRIVQGTYTGFGQTLQIERGTLVFNGPVDNPAIDIVAYRRYLPVEAGVALTGTANAPRLTLVSRPDVPEPDKLSWLVLGVGSEAARNSGETAALQAATATLLSAGGAPVPNLARAFGLDVVSVRTGQVGATSSTQSATAASAQDNIVTLGKRLSERLFVSYEQSLRGLQNLLRLQYEITDRLSVRLKTGTDSSLDLLWTYRYD